MAAGGKGNARMARAAMDSTSAASDGQVVALWN
jgi:hypothetical protein